MNESPNEQGFRTQRDGDGHDPAPRLRRRPWLFRTLRFAPLALTVALAFLANVLQAVPPSERSRVVLDGSTTRLVSHNDPIY